MELGDAGFAALMELPTSARVRLGRKRMRVSGLTITLPSRISRTRSSGGHHVRPGVGVDGNKIRCYSGLTCASSLLNPPAFRKNVHSGVFGKDSGELAVAQSFRRSRSRQRTFRAREPSKALSDAIAAWIADYRQPDVILAGAITLPVPFAGNRESPETLSTGELRSVSTSTRRPLGPN
jgi:hypothetical protein